MGAFRRRWPGLSYGRGEDWHYVGDTGEPAFGTHWANGAGDRNLAFRIREAGVVDVQGYIQNTNAPTAPSSATIFTLPTDYRPSADTFQGFCVVETNDPSDGYITVPVNVSSAGGVAIPDISSDPVFSGLGFNYAGVAQYVYIQGFFFLVPASAP